MKEVTELGIAAYNVIFSYRKGKYRERKKHVR